MSFRNESLIDLKILINEGVEYARSFCERNDLWVEF